MHAYALLKNPQHPLVLPEGTCSGLQLIQCDQLSVVIERELNLESLQQNDAALVQAVLAHDRIIRSLFQQTTVLPLRFTSFLAVDELMRDLSDQQQVYIDQLTRFEGKAEYLLKLVPLAIAELSIAPELRGKEYFLAKKRQHLIQEQHQRLQQKQLEDIVQAIAMRYEMQPSIETQQIYVLAERDPAAGILDAIVDLQQHCSAWQLQIGEPLPPFHFV